jgi:hypothetical protein
LRKNTKNAKDNQGAQRPNESNFQADLEKAKKTAKHAKGVMTAAASQMFAFYTNLLSVEAMYALNKIVINQTGSGPYVDLQNVSQISPRGMSCKPFNNCVLFHLLTVFPINTVEQEKYCIMNVLKKPQRVNVPQFVR